MNMRTLSSAILTALALLLGTTLALSVSKAQAGELDPQEVDRVESIGVISGAVIGAAVGGPPGAVVSAAVGGWISDKVLAGRHNKLLKAELASTHEQILALQEANARLQDQLIAQHAGSSSDLLATTSDSVASTSCCGDSELVLHFRSGSSQVEKLYEGDLAKFVTYVQSLPKAVVEIYGYADRRGEHTDNLWLSQERVQSVEQQLRKLGLRDFTYETTALGENEPTLETDSVETNFYDRRVVLRVRNSHNEYLSSSR